MALDQPLFYFFLLIILFITFRVKQNNRWKPLLLGNIVFLAILNGYIGIFFLALSSFNYFIVQTITYSSSYFQMALLLNISFLIFYKYLIIFLPNNSPLIANLALPVGISFFVFQQLSYLIDMHRKRGTIVKHMGHYLTYSFFFGYFVSGPIERASNIIPRLTNINYPDTRTVRAAWLFIYWGLFKKIAVADNIAPIVFKLFDPSKISIQSKDVLPAFIFNKYEIYTNFSGYTDIAIGIGLLFGFNLTQNFKRPFASRTIKEFWKKWHLSLSYWIRDYVFYPLSTTRFSRLGIYSILTITFTLFAIWHDLRITFIIYGLLQVLLIFLSNIIGIHIEKIHKNIKNKMIYEAVSFLRIIWVYIFLISLPSIFFGLLTLIKLLTYLIQSSN
jgi:alginate O-acetyltransferase complex protein AlgI